MEKIPQHGDIRVAFVPEVIEHALTITVPSIEVARDVYEAIAAVDAFHEGHDHGYEPARIFVQRYDDGTWIDIDPGEYDRAQRRADIDVWE